MTSSLMCKLIQRSTSACMIDYSQCGCIQGYVTSLNFEKLLIVFQKWYKIETYLPWKTNRKLYVVYRMAPIPLSLSDFKGHFSFLILSTTFNSHTLGNIACNTYNMFTGESETAFGL